jgi:transposase
MIISENSTADCRGGNTIQAPISKAGVYLQRRRDRKVAEDRQKRLHEKPAETGCWLRRVVEGHLNDYGVPFNIRALTQFVEEVKRLWLKSPAAQNEPGTLQPVV